MTLSPTIDTTKTPVNPYYLKVKDEIQSNPIDFRARYKALQTKIINRLRNRGYSKKVATQIFNGVIPYYIVHMKYIDGRPATQEGIVDLKRLENEFEILVKDTHENLIDLYWKG